MPKKQRNRDKNKRKRENIHIEKTLVKVTLDISQEVVDLIELGECFKICYISNEPPLLRIRRVGKEDIITHKFSMGRPYKEETGISQKKKPSNFELVHVPDDNYPVLGDPDECGSYWAKCPKVGTSSDSSGNEWLLKHNFKHVMEPADQPEESIRELCQI